MAFHLKPRRLRVPANKRVEMARVVMRTDGDCFRCCVATVLGLAYEDVPSFNEPEEDQWIKNLSMWCLYRGIRMLLFLPHEGTIWAHFHSHGLWIAGGPGPRGIPHAVVYDGPTMCHDPHESGEGLLKITDGVVLFREEKHV